MSINAQPAIHANNWADVLSIQPRVILDAYAAKGWITKSGAGDKFHTLIIDSCFYEDVTFKQLDLDTPFRFGSNLWAFRDTLAWEPYLYYVKEILIKFKDGVKTVHITEFPPMSNLDNTCLESYFQNEKVYKSKDKREKKLKEKKLKEKKDKKK